MRILLTNDDGVYAQGLWSLARELVKVAEVVVAAPDREQSGVGTAVTFHDPVRAEEISPLIPGVKTYSIQGTPADCVILALGKLFQGQVDALISGINGGANLGHDVFISGTVGAAFQGHFQGLPTLAISVCALKNIRYEVAARLARLLVETGLPKGVLLNANVPNLPQKKIEGIEITRLGSRSYADIIKAGHDGRRRYYWIFRGKPAWSYEEGTDIWAVHNHRISLTPLHSDLTSDDAPALDQLRAFVSQSLGRPPLHIPAEKSAG